MRYYLAFDDTDNLGAPYGTGKVARWFESRLPEGCRLWAVVRQQLLVHDDVPYTSHNSGACLVVEAENGRCRNQLLETAIEHLREHSLEGSDPGLCLAAETNPGMSLLMAFGRRCTSGIVLQEEAFTAAKDAGVHLSAHGGTGDGVIGALASVGLTAWGWSGRFIEMGGLRSLPDNLTVAALQDHGLWVTSIDRDAPNPGPEDMVHTNGWCRPRLMGGQPVLLVQKGNGRGVAGAGREASQKPYVLNHFQVPAAPFPFKVPG